MQLIFEVTLLLNQQIGYLRSSAMSTQIFALKKVDKFENIWQFEKSESENIVHSLFQVMRICER